VDGTAQRKIDSPAPDAAAAWRSDRIMGWFGRILPLSFFESLMRDLEIVGNSSIFTLRVTTWMMMMQRLSASGTLAVAVSELLHGKGRELLQPCKRVREENISANTGAYTQARQRVPVEAARRVAGRSFEQLHEISSGGGLRDRLFVLDGSSIRLAHSPALLAAYPPAENQHGKSHWPVMRIAVMHHVVTALAMVPEFGPMYGGEAVSEQGLAEPLIDKLPPASVLIGDRNFGVFSVMWHAHCRAHKVLVRLTGQRARRLIGGDRNAGEHKVVWAPSREDRRAHPLMPAGAHIEGRLIVARPEGMKEELYLFTTLEEPTEEAVALYKERWHIETDLRSLKEQVRLHTIPARSPHLAACELLMAIAGYNLIRSVMAEAARQVDVEPRRLSFSRSRAAFLAFARAADHADSAEQFDRHWRILIRSIGQCKLPKRSRPPAPRAVWFKRQNFPHRVAPK
jgi:putative transposase